jgi:hypothetical protein
MTFARMMAVDSDFVFSLDFFLQLCPLADPANLCHFAKLGLESGHRDCYIRFGALTCALIPTPFSPC